MKRRVNFMKKKIFGNKKISSLDRTRTIQLIDEEVEKMKVGVRFWRYEDRCRIKEELYKINNNYWDSQKIEEPLNVEEYANILLDLKNVEPPNLEDRVRYLEDRVRYLEDRMRYLLQFSIYE